jgi:hypothetical protein
MVELERDVGSAATLTATAGGADLPRPHRL